MARRMGMGTNRCDGAAGALKPVFRKIRTTPQKRRRKRGGRWTRPIRNPRPGSTARSSRQRLLSACNGAEKEAAPLETGASENVPEEAAEEKTPYEMEPERRASFSDNLLKMNYEGETYAIVGGNTLQMNIIFDHNPDTRRPNPDSIKQPRISFGEGV